MAKRILAKTYYFSLILGLLALSLTSGNVRKRKVDTAIPWISLEEAQEMTKKEPRKIFIDIYTSWCGPCKLMDRTTFVDERVTEYVKGKFYAVKLNAESTRITTFKGQKITEKELAKSFEVQGYPTILLLNADLELLQANLGYLKPGPFRKLLEQYYQTY